MKGQADDLIDQIKNNKNENRNKELDYYNLAICYSVKNQVDSTFIYLHKSIERFPNYNRLILADSDFRYLHKTSGWDKLTNKIDSLQLAITPLITNPQLAKELLHIGTKDQYARGFGLKFKDPSIFSLDKENLIQVEKIIKEYGWPTYSMVGKTAADGAFLVIQHADTSIQTKYLNQIVESSKKQEASSESVALLVDRLTAARSHTQIYGTQVFQVKDKNTGKLSKYTYYPIENEDKVDIRRKEMGLIPLKDYLKLFGIDYVPGTKFQPPTFN